MRKRNPKPRPPSIPEAIAALTRTLGFVGASGIKIRWNNFKGNLVVTFDGLYLKVDQQTGQAVIIRTDQVVADAVADAVKKPVRKSVSG